MAGTIEIIEANLKADENWNKAAIGCKYVIHLASPVDIFRGIQPGSKYEKKYVQYAVNGTLRVLRAAHASGVCKRVVVTSSVAAIMNGHIEKSRNLTEEDWNNPDTAICYMKSKSLSELAAWKYSKKVGLSMATINPVMVIGPFFSLRCTSLSIGRLDYLLTGKSSYYKGNGLAKHRWAIVDVRDVAFMHVEAML